MIQQVGKYILESELGKGAMGSVWLSRHPGLAIPVAVKILDPALAAEDPDYMDRFIKEGKMAASINHQNVVRIIDAGQDGSVFYLVMEYIEGADAKQLVEERGALPVSEVLELAICTAEALSEAHKAGIVHRDIKPDNILVTTDGKVKLADLGIAKQLNDDYGTTMAGATIGTPYYIAPEQAMDSSTVDTRCDIYALGGTLYHLLTGSVPFTGPSAMSILMKHSQEELQHPKERKADLPDSICDVVCKMMEKHPDDRYQNCADLLKDLYAVRDNKKTAASPGKKKKHFKAPSKKRVTMSSMDKELGDLSSAGKSVKKVPIKKKKTSAHPALIAFLFIIPALLMLILFLPEKSKPTASEGKNKSGNGAGSSRVAKTKKTQSTDSVKSRNKGPIKVFTDPPPHYLALDKSRTIVWNRTWSLFAEFRGSYGTIVSKTENKKWSKGAKALYIDSKGNINYEVAKTGKLNASVKVNDNRYHKVLLVCKKGKVSLYIDTKLQDSKSLMAEDGKNFTLKVGTNGVNSRYNFEGHIQRVAFWDDAIPDSNLNLTGDGKFDPEKTDYYYEYKLKKSSNNGDITKQILEGLKKDNPGVLIGSHRIKIENKDLIVNLGDTKVKDISSLKGYPIKVLTLMRTKVVDFSVLRDLPTVELDLSMVKPPVSLKDLNYKTLRRLRLMLVNLKDIEEFKKFNLDYLAIKQHPLITRSIKHMKLYRLDMDSANLQILFNNLNKSSLRELKMHMAKGVKDISKLKGFNLKVFHLTESPCENFSVLKGMPIEDVNLMGTNAKDLNFLEGAPVKSLVLSHHCEDVKLLRSFKQLQNLAVPVRLWTKEMEFLRNSKVQIEGYSRKKPHWWLSWGQFRNLNSTKFWQEFDERRR